VAAPRIGLIDSGVDGAHPVLSGVTIVRQGCGGALFPAAHGTAVASLLVGQGENFESVIPGATLHASDIFCGHGGASLSLLAIALDWMAREKVPVVNISLVGAKSVLLTALVRAMSSRGFLLVAAVGNDGPTAPPLYPAAYPDVVGVTGVDGNRRVLPEACRGEQVDFAAAGADFEAAAVGGGFDEMRGTSFARRSRRWNPPHWISATTARIRLMVKGWWGRIYTPAAGTKETRSNVLATEDRGSAAARGARP
jgi:subtilisin family serine protease